MHVKFTMVILLAFWGSVLALPPDPGKGTGLDTPCDVMPNCLRISAAMGMQLYSIDTQYEKPEIKYSDPDKKPSLERTVSISGVVTSLWNKEAYVYDQYKKESSIKIYYKETTKTDSSNQPIKYTDTKRISLKHFKIAPGGDPFMQSVLDSNWIYVPYSLSLNISDSIVIEGYSAEASNYCDYSCYLYYRPEATIIGQYTVFPTTSTLKQQKQPISTPKKKRNRDAIGKKQKHNTARKVVY